MSTTVRTLAAAVLAGCLALPGAGAARAQVPDETTTSTSTSTSTSTTEPEPTPTTAPAPDDLAPTTTTTPAPSVPTTTLPGTTTTTTPPRTPVPAPPAVGGDAAAPPGTAPVLSPELLDLMNSVHRTGPNSTAKLLDALAPLVAMGMSEQEAVQAGFGRFPVGGRATFTDDWWFPRFVPVVHLHEGTDIFAAYGTPARAPADGTLEQSFNPVGGLSAYVTEADGTYYYLAHLSRYEAGQVSGQTVKAGDVIGYVGDSGNARGTSPHVHFEVHPRGGGPTDPKPRLDAWLQAALDGVPALVAATAPVLAQRSLAGAAEEQDLTVVGHTDLGGGGGYGDVAVVGDTALVAAGDAAPGPAPAPVGEAPASDTPACAASVSVVDLRRPASPSVAATITLAPSRRIEDIDALTVHTPAFSGDVAAVVVAPCNPGDGGTGVAYYDVTDPAAPKLLGRVGHPRRLADDSAATTCGPALRGTCPRTGRTVRMQQRPDGRVISLSSARAPGSDSQADIFAVDLTDPRSPAPLGFVPLRGRPGATSVDDGCSPVRLSAPSQPTARSGLFDVDGFGLAPAPPLADGLDIHQADAFPAVANGGGRRLAVAPESTWWSSSWALRVDGPSGPLGEKAGCPRPLSGSARSGPTHGAAGPTAGELVYVGRGCPTRTDVDGTTIPADPYLTDPTGRIALADAALAPPQHGLSGQGCTPASRLARATQAGAVGLVVAGSFLADPADAVGTADAAAEAGEAVAPAAAPGGTPAATTTAAAGQPTAIPGLQLRKPDGDAMREALCPVPTAPDKGCGAPAGAVSGAVVELPGRWGGLRLLDVSDPEAPREVEVYRTPNAATSTPSDPDASFAVEAAVADGDRVYAAWGSDGLRVLDLASGSPVEVGSFLPPRAADPGASPLPAHVAGVASTGRHIVVSDRASGLWVLDKRPPEGTRGYWLADAAGGVHAFGDAALHGTAEAAGLTSPIVGMAPTPSARGYWLVSSDGGVYAFGDAPFAGSLAGAGTAPVVGVASTPSGKGYWLVSADGGVFAFGDAPFHGSLAASPPVWPVVALVATPSGRGYHLFGADGGVFAFGDAAYLGSMAAAPPASPVVGATATPSGQGYWLVSADGGVFAFGDARFKGAAPAPLTAPVVGGAAMAGVRGYWLATADGGVYALGAPFLGTRTVGPGTRAAPPIVAVAAVPRPPVEDAAADRPSPVTSAGSLRAV